MTFDLTRRYVVVGSRRLSNYLWTLLSSIGGLGFLLTGLSSYQHGNLLPWIHAENIVFFPQGLVMCFYGLLGLLLSFYISLTILWSVGGGFNIFDKQKQMVRIFRWGWPGKNRRIDLTYPMDEVTAIRLELKDGLSPRRTIYLCVGPREIPLTRVGQPMTLEDIEKLGSEIAQFLQKDLLT
jgi:Ycf4